MGNTRVQTHGLQFQGEIVLSSLGVSLIESTQRYGSKLNSPHAIGYGFNTNLFIGEQVADVDPPGIPVDQAAIADAMRSAQGQALPFACSAYLVGWLVSESRRLSSRAMALTLGALCVLRRYREAKGKA